MMMHQDQAPGSNATGDAGKAIIHARLAIGDTVLIGNDVPSTVFEKIRSVYSQLRDRFGVSWSIIHERTMAQ
jgi:uncharacterized glyoxalase superfamily protein PhnB